ARVDAAHALLRIDPANRKAQEFLNATLKLGEPVVRLLAAESINPDARAVVPALVAMLREDNPLSRRTAVGALTRLGVAGVPALLDALKDKDPQVRLWAAVALRENPELVTKEFAPRLEDVVRSGAGDVRAVVIVLLASLGADGRRAAPA